MNFGAVKVHMEKKMRKLSFVYNMRQKKINLINTTHI